MISTGDFRKGLPILVEGVPYIILEYTVQTPSARGAATLVRVRARNVLTSALQDLTFKSGDRFNEPDLEKRKINFMYAADDQFHFMDEESYEQIHLPRRSVEDDLQFLLPSGSVPMLTVDGRPAGLQLPASVELAVTETEPGVRGDTVSNVTKPATLETGAVVQVPLFVNVGDVLKVDTREKRYISRA